MISHKATQRIAGAAALVGLTCVVAISSASGNGPAPKYTGVQVDARERAANSVRADVERLPTVARGGLSRRDREQVADLEAEGGAPALVSTGRRLGVKGDRTLFRSTDGSEACIVGRGNAACMPVDQLSPHFEFGYDPATGQTSLSVTALGDVTDIRATTSVSTAIPLDVRDGESQFTLPGELRRVTWATGGQSFAQDFPAGASVPPGDR